MTMFFFYIGLGIMAIGLGLVSWLLLSEKKEPEKLAEPKKEDKKEKTIQETPENLLVRLGLEKKSAKESKQIGSPPLISLFKKFTSLKKRGPEERPVLPKFDTSLNSPSQTGTASLRLNEPTQKSNQPVLNQANVAPLPKEFDAQQKYEKLEILLKEKTEALESAEKTLSHELKAQKEFNKVRDILEKEIKDKKDQIRKLEVELTEVHTEVNSHLKRIDQLEEKVKKLEKEIRDKEIDIKNAQEDIQKEKNRYAQLEGKNTELEKTIQEKDKKIGDLVNHLKAVASSPAAETTTAPERTTTTTLPQQLPAQPTESQNKVTQESQLVDSSPESSTQPEDKKEVSAETKTETNTNIENPQKSLTEQSKDENKEFPQGLETTQESNYKEKSIPSTALVQKPVIHSALESGAPNTTQSDQLKPKKDDPKPESNHKENRTGDSEKLTLLPDIAKQNSEQANSPPIPTPIADDLKKANDQTDDKDNRTANTDPTTNNEKKSSDPAV